MKRTLSLVLALVMILGTFTVFAETTDAEMEAGLLLEQLEVLVGSESGDLMLDQDLQRQQAVVLLSRLMGEEELAENFPVEEDEMYPDEDSAYYSPFLAWARANGTFQGNAEGNFKPLETITNREYAKVLLTALGYKQDVDFKYVEALQFAKDLGIEVYGLEVVNLKRGMMAVMTVEALKVNVKDLDKTLAETLGLAMPKAEELEIVSVTADNLKEVEVVFNQKVDKATVTDSNVKVNGLEGSVSLKEDGVTAVIALEGKMVNQGKYKVIVENVATEGKVAIERTEVAFTAFDQTLPRVEDVVVTGPRNITLVFSEPIDKAGKVEVKQDNLTLGNSVKVSGNKVDVQVFTNFVDGREYSVTVKDFEDFAGYKNVINTLNFTYEKDETPPVATVEKVEQEYVVVSFNKPVKGVAANRFYHTFSAWNASSVRDAAGEKINVNDSVNEVYVYFYEGNDGDKAIPAGGTTFGILGSTIKDNWGNALGNQEFKITAVADRVAPEVQSIEVRTEDTIRITFTKNVNFARKNIEILDGAGKSISGMYLTVTEVKGNVYDVKMSKPQAGKTVTVSIKDVADTTLFGNVLSLHTQVIEITDKTAPKVEAVYYNLEGPEKDGDKYNKYRELYVVFDEAVDADTALVAKNYALVRDNKVTILSAAPQFDALNNRVKLPLTKAEANLLGEDIKSERKDQYEVTLQIINVKDLAGNTIIPQQHEITGDLVETNKVHVNYAHATSTTRLVVGFSDLLSDVTVDAFTVNGKKNFTLTQSDSATATTLTFDVPNEDAFDTDAADVTFAVANDKGIKNSYGNKAEFVNNAVVQDKIAPTIINSKDNKVVVQGNKVTIQFSEKMDKETFSKNSFLVEGYTVTEHAVNVDKLVLTLNKDFDTNREEIMITYNLDVTDANGNKLDLEKGTNTAYDYKTVKPEEPEVDAEVAAVEAAFLALPAAKDVTIEDKDAIRNAQAAYEALTAEQKSMVSEEAKNHANAAAAALDALLEEPTDPEEPVAELSWAEKGQYISLTNSYTGKLNIPENLKGKIEFKLFTKAGVEMDNSNFTVDLEDDGKLLIRFDLEIGMYYLEIWADGELFETSKDFLYL